MKNCIKLVIVLLTLVLGSYLRLHLLSTSPSHLEIQSILHATEVHFARASRAFDTPPFFYVLLSKWTEYGFAIEWVRLLPALFSIAALLIFTIVLREQRAISLIPGVLLAATSVHLVHAGHTLEPFAPFLLHTAFALFFLERFLKRKEDGCTQSVAAVGLIVSLCLAMTTHLSALSLVMGVLMYVAIRTRSFYRLIKTLSLCLPSIALFFYFDRLYLSYQSGINSWNLAPSTLDHWQLITFELLSQIFLFPESGHVSSFCRTAAWVLFAGAGFSLIVLTVRHWRSALPWLGFLGTSLSVCIVMHLIWRPVFSYQTVAFLSFPCILVICALIHQEKSKPVLYAVLTFFFLIPGYNAYSLLTAYHHTPAAMIDNGTSTTAKIIHEAVARLELKNTQLSGYPSYILDSITYETRGMFLPITVSIHSLSCENMLPGKNFLVAIQSLPGTPKRIQIDTSNMISTLLQCNISSRVLYSDERYTLYEFSGFADFSTGSRIGSG